MRLLKPLINNIEKHVSVQAQKAYNLFFNAYTRYLDQTYDRHSYFNSIVFKNEQKLLRDYYIPLTLLKTPTAEKIRINCFPEEEINAIRRLLIVDTAGMGKTTISKYLFINCVEEQLGIPIFIELRKLSRRFDLLDFVIEQLTDLNGSVKDDLFYELLKSGKFIFFLDGYDEIRDEERAAVSAGIQAFVTKAYANRFIITSREEIGLQAFPQFQRYHIQPLSKKEAYTLLKKYTETKLADDLIARLELPQNASIHEFLANPLLTSLLYKSYEYKQIIPLKRHIFYRQVYEALFEVHDLAKEGGEFNRSKRSGLDIDRMEHLLRAIGAISYKAGKTEFDDIDAIAIVKQALILCAEKKTAPSEVLHDLTHAVPLLVREGNHLRWSHRSIQEYFAAQFICHMAPARQSDLLLSFYENNNIVHHANLIRLYADINPQGFNISIGSRLATELLESHQKLFDQPQPTLSDRQLSARKSLMAGRTYFYFKKEADSVEGAAGLTQDDFKSLNDRLTQLLSTEDSSRLSWRLDDFIGIGQISQRTDSAASTFYDRDSLTFISYIDSPAIYNLDQLGHPNKVSIISDDLDIEFNLPVHFDRTTNAMAHTTTWSFDPEAARAFLISLESLAKQQNEIDVW